MSRRRWQSPGISGAWRGASGIVALGLGVCVSAQAAAPAVGFTADQVARGRVVYASACGVCHGRELQGAAAVALTGPSFARTWGDGHHMLRDLYESVAKQMPKNAPGSLSESDNLGLTAFLLARNGYSAGAVPLTASALDVDLGAEGEAAQTQAPPAPVYTGPWPQPPASVVPATTRVPDDAELRAPAAGDWLTYNRTLAGERFSPLAQISIRNARQLQARCLLQLGELGSFETSPVAYRGTLYLTTVHKVFAVDGATCALRWSYNYVPPDPEHLPGNRGVALYRGALYRGTADGHLIALDAATGKLLWDVRAADSAKGYEITGAPVAFGGKVFTGDAGADTGIRGRVYAFDAATGALAWSFNMIPAAGEPAARTWGNAAALDRGGGATWSSMAIDPAAGSVLVPTGNPAPDFYDTLRPGSNLYTDSVVALDMRTGHLQWYVQQVPHDVHDWDTAAAPALFEQGGRRLMAVASKDGLLYVYDRDSHQMLQQLPFTTRENIDVPLSPDHPVHVCPGALGQYNGPAWSPALGLLFVGAADRCNTLQRAEPRYVPGGVYFGGRFIIDPPVLQSGWIRAFDPRSGREVWQVHRKDPVLAAVTPTAGGLLLTGDSGGEFLALNASSGEILYRFQTGGPVAGGITSYEAGGRQYIAVPSGSSSRDSASATGAATLVVFGLP